MLLQRRSRDDPAHRAGRTGPTRPAANRVKDTRGTAQRTGDALIELARQAITPANLPAHGGARPNLLLTVSLSDLRGAPAGRAGPTAGAGEPIRLHEPHTCTQPDPPPQPPAGDSTSAHKHDQRYGHGR
ncbi:MAG: DUF222 domain-containing protein [Mycobacteriales bacterium]